MKPIPIHLKKGQLIDTQKGFTDNFNYVVDFINNLNCGIGLKLDRTDYNHPIIRLDESKIESTKPFFVEKNNDNWRIYIPSNSVNSDFLVFLNASTETDWYTFTLPTLTDDGSYNLVLHIKKHALEQNSNNKLGLSLELMTPSQTTAQSNQQKANDIWFITLGEFQKKGDDITWNQGHVGEKTDLNTYNDEIFPIGVTCTAKGLNPTMTVKLIETTAPIIGGVLNEYQIQLTTMDVYYTLDFTSDNPDAYYTENDATDETHQSILIYSFDNNYVLTDLRSQVNQLVFYP